MHVAEIWRYPVKSMAGERLESALVGPLGIAGDRVVHVEHASGHVVTARSHPRLLGHHATLDGAGEPQVDGVLWSEPEVLREVVDIVGPGARLVRDESASRFDILPLLVATDGAIRAFGHDGRRLRPNIAIGGVEGLAERSWEGQRLRIGDAVIGIEDLRGRCVMTTFDPDTQKQNVNVLKEIARKFDGKLALNCYVIQGGTIRVGDAAELVEDSERSAQLRLARYRVSFVATRQAGTQTTRPYGARVAIAEIPGLPPWASLMSSLRDSEDNPRGTPKVKNPTLAEIARMGRPPPPRLRRAGPDGLRRRKAGRALS